MSTQLRETTLAQVHKNLNAKMVDFAGFLMPVQYSGAKEECEAVRSSVGVFDVSHMGEFWVKGPEAAKFVNYVITNEIEALENSKAVYSPLLNHEGKILDDLIAYKFSNEEILICVNASNVEKDWNWISQFASKFKINLTNASDETSLLALQGPKSENVLEKVLHCDLKDMAYYSILKVNHQGKEFIIARTGYTGEDGFEVFTSNQNIEWLWNEFMKTGVKPCGLASRDVLRLEVCYPLYGNDLNEELTPFDTGLRWTVKMAKTEFVGKAALEKTNPQKKLIKFSLEKGIPRHHYPIQNANNDVVGVTTSGTHSVAIGKGIGMALVDASVSTKDPLFINIRNQNLPINIQTKPFVTGGHK